MDANWNKTAKSADKTVGIDIDVPIGFPWVGASIRGKIVELRSVLVGEIKVEPFDQLV